MLGVKRSGAPLTVTRETSLSPLQQFATPVRWQPATLENVADYAVRGGLTAVVVEPELVGGRVPPEGTSAGAVEGVGAECPVGAAEGNPVSGSACRSRSGGGSELEVNEGVTAEFSEQDEGKDADRVKRGPNRDGQAPDHVVVLRGELDELHEQQFGDPRNRVAAPFEVDTDGKTHLVVTDLRMPPPDGLALLAEIQSGRSVWDATDSK